MVVGKRERQVAVFDEGELWCTDEADPPSNPTGWYFRPPGGTQLVWIGPFASDDEAMHAPFSGDALRDARRYLDLWRRGEPAPRPKPVIAAAVAPPRPAPVETGTPQMELPLSGDVVPAPARTAGKRRPPTRPAQQQLMLSLDLR